MSARAPRLGWLCALAVLLAAGCGDAPSSADGGSTAPDVDAGDTQDAGGVPADGGNDAGAVASDGGVDGGADAGTDGGGDAGADAGTDGGSDAGPATDAGADGGADAGGPDSGVDAGQSCPAHPVHDAGDLPRLPILGDTGSTMGVFDPSVFYPAGATAGFMAYTSVPSGPGLHSRLAASNDRGGSWAFYSDVNQSSAITILTTDLGVCGATACSGSWVHETPDVIVDPGDPDSARLLKVFTHSYYFQNDRDKVHYEIGGISVFTAGGPGGPWQEDRVIGWNSSSPRSSTGVRQNMHTDPALAGLRDCILIAEPAAISVASPDGGFDIALAVGCLRFNADAGLAPIEIRLLRSTDHGRTFSFVATLLDEQDAIALGAAKRQLNGADLFSSRGKVYLFAHPDGWVPYGFVDAGHYGYSGCLLVEVTDLDAGTVARCEGAPRLSASFMGAPGQFIGACTADEGATDAGVLVPTQVYSATDIFRIRASRLSPP